MSRLSIPDAFKDAFDQRLADQPEVFRNALNTLVKMKVFNLENDSSQKHAEGQRGRNYIDHSLKILLHNAILLQSLVLKPTQVQKLLEDQSERKKMVELLRVLLVDRQPSEAQFSISPKLEKFLNELETYTDLREQELTNPFTELPQKNWGKGRSLFEVTFLQDSVLENKTNMLLSYLQGDVKEAYDLAKSYQGSSDLVRQYAAKIVKEYEDALGFQRFLQEW